MNFFKALYINNRFFYMLIGMMVLFVISFFFQNLFNAFMLLFFILLVFLMIDIAVLFLLNNGISAARNCPEKLSNGDDNEIFIKIKNHYSFAINIRYCRNSKIIFATFGWS